MKKSTMLAVAMILAGFAVLSLAKPRFSPGPSSAASVEAVDASNQAAAKANNLSGEWILDPSRSDMPRMWGGGNRHEGQGSWGGHPGGEGGAMGNREGGRGRMRLPRHIQIAQNGSLVSFADSTGAVLQEIAFDSHAPAAASQVMRRTGQWKSGALEVQREGRGGATFTESWSLQDAGTLVCTTKIQGGEMGDRTMKRVYQRAGVKTS
jgi:hypothetical protein